ncbi:hypothetical protein [Streptosporangium sp. NPDC006007]|uniref:hypothetical protein n=1 Tax=Streptosporangium sp. NPDC006007 TaxID=3154575 RepID=UPI0033AF4667
MDGTCQLTRSQFVAIQFPIVDLRLLLSSDTGRLNRPSWPDPDLGREFLRGVGVIQPLVDINEPRAWRGQQSFIDASSLIRFPPAWHERSPLWIKPIYRRLLCMNTTWRAEIGVVTKWKPGVGPRTINALANKILELPLRISGHEKSVLDFDQLLTADLLSRTTSTSHASMSWWMSSGLPLLLIDELDTRRNKIVFSTIPIIARNRPVPTFVIRRREYHVEQARYIRGELSRTYHQLETLRLILRAWRIHRDTLNVRLVRDLLASELKRMSRRSRNSHLQPNLIGITAATVEFPTDDLAAMRKDLRQESKGLVRRLDEFTKVLENKNNSSSYTIQLGRLVVNSGDNFTFNDRAAGVFGRNSAVQGNSFVAGDNATVPSAELGSLLSAIAALKPELDPDSSNDIEVASAEIVEADDPSKIRTALQKIAGIATMAGTAGTAVIEAVKLLAASLEIGS